MTRVTLIIAMWLLLSGAIVDSAFAQERSPLVLLAISLGLDALAGLAVYLELQGASTREEEPAEESD